ncbi:MAG: cytochrome P450 [Deltaproteobacteria bacterium]|nr:cytochrome P450 [Deltaproteobacteria bacterium]
MIGSLLEFRNRRIALQHRVAREYGDIARLRMGVFDVVMVSSPELAHEVLVEKDDAFVKSHGLSLFARPLLGNGLLTSERAFHRKQRRMMAPAFVQKRIAAYADVMAERAERSVDRMLESDRFDLADEAMRTTLEIVAKTLFDAEVGAEASEIGEALTEAMERIMGALLALVPMPPAVPTPNNLRMKRAIARLDRTVYRLIRERRERGEDRGDVLSMLLASRDDDDGSGMDDRQVRDEAMTVFLAGHETTANALVWSFYLLAKHPAARARMETEIDDALRGRVPRFADLRSLPFTLSVVKEAMRLFPPAYVLGRRAERDVSIGGHSLSKGQVVMINVAGIHRRPDVHARPDVFDPDRFTPEREKALPRNAYMPFGAGPRICIGNHFALMEGQILLATYVRRLRLELVDPALEADTDPLITLRPKGGMPMRAVPRAPRSAEDHPTLVA